MEGGSVHEGGLELNERMLDSVALAAMRTGMHEETADPECLEALKALFFGLHKRIYKAKAALETRCKSIALKDKGNAALKQQRYEEAIDWYTQVPPAGGCAAIGLRSPGD